MSDPVLIAIVSAISAFGGAFLAMLPQLVVAMRTQHKVAEIHALTNSLSEKLLTTTRSDALQEGHTLGVAAALAGSSLQAPHPSPAPIDPTATNVADEKQRSEG